MTGITRRTLVLSTLGGALVGTASAAHAQTPVFYRSPGCSCCHVWTERMAEAGLAVELRDTDDLGALSASYGIPDHLAGCHVGEMGGYVISGHVPPADIKTLLAERPEGRALLVPGMPIGSPGMETDGTVEPYDVLLLKADGSTVVFASHG